jgi:hypothetical protein
MTTAWELSWGPRIFGLIILAALGVYLLFMAINNLALAQRTASGVVLAKGYREAGTTYFTQIIDGRPVVRPQGRPEMYVIKLDVTGQQAESAVTKQTYDAVTTGDQVQVTYQRRRLTGGLRVLDVRPEQKGGA